MKKPSEWPGGERRECYPSAPTDPVEREAWVTKRNAMIAACGAGAAVAAAKDSVGAGKSS